MPDIFIQTTANRIIQTNNTYSIFLFTDANIKREPSTPFKDHPITGPTLELAQPMVRLFIYQETTTQLTEGETKAKRIEYSFKNPFQKFLPAKKFSEISTDISKNKDEMNISEVATEGETSSKISDDDVVEVAHRYTKASERYTKTVVDGSANASAKQSKKRKQDNSGASGDEDETEGALRVKKHKKKGKKKLNKAETNTQSSNASQFVPFDYNNASLDFGKAENGEAGKEGVFSPYKKLNEKGRKYNSKVHMKSGERSMTFNKRK